MTYQLTKTLLSQKISQRSIQLGLMFYSLLLLIFTWDNPELTANGHQVFEQGHYWKAFTTTFMHGDLVHLGHNTLFFAIFAVLLNSYFGFWVFPVLSLIAGAATNLIVLKIYDPSITLVGISGVIYFMAAFWMTLFNGIERQMKLARRLIITTGVSLILFFPEVFERNVSYLAHGVGFGLGILSGLLYFKLNLRKIRSYEIWEEKKRYPIEDLLYEDPYIESFQNHEQTIEDQEKTIH